jgi:hypothetical protein
MKKSIKGYKAFNKGLICKGFQFEEGKTYKTDKAVICQEGFHFCVNPLDVLDYYDLCDSEFAEVEAIGKTVGHKEDSKHSTTEIKIGARMSFKAFVEASVSFLLSVKKPKSGYRAQLASSGDYARLASSGGSARLASSGDNAQLASSGDNAKLASSGDNAQLASSGNYAKLASSGDRARLASSGGSARLASSGDYARLASSGDYARLASSGGSAKLASSGVNAKLASSGVNAKLASSGYYAQLASSGDRAQLASSGDYAQLASSGDNAQLELSGQDSVGAGIGFDNRIKGKKGDWITLAEWKYDEDKKRYVPLCVKSAQIDGEKLKEDVWYELKDGEFQEVK